ncbi:hypothetical protein TNCT_299041, partial [Trichonephila clavata]
LKRELKNCQKLLPISISGSVSQNDLSIETDIICQSSSRIFKKIEGFFCITKNTNIIS